MSCDAEAPPGEASMPPLFEICLRACRAMQRLRQVRRRCHHAGAARTFAIGTEVKASSASACAWEALDRSKAYMFARLG